MLRSRIHLLCTVLAASTACGGGGSSPGASDALPVRTVATFQGEFDPATGRLSFTTVPGPALAAVELPGPVADGVPGSGPDETLELVTEALPAEPGVVTDGCGTGVDSYDGYITLRSFYTSQTFGNVYIQLTALSPSGFEACNSEVGGGYDATFGLWSYGTLGTRGTAESAATRRWQFRFPASERFSFRGRILGDYSAPEFDWTPAALGWPDSRFEVQPTTLAHIVWNGTTFVDALGGGITFVQNAADDVDNAVGLWSPEQHWQGPFAGGAGGNWFVADADHGGDAVDTSGTFTACVKFKPGARPEGSPSKVYLGKGQAEPPAGGGAHEGWALTQTLDAYTFHYKTDAVPENTIAPVGGGASPEGYTYDYFCGGRDGTWLRSAAHGREPSASYPVGGSFASPGTLPLVIGAYPDGTHAALDGGVYEAIIDSRPPTVEVMRDIVTRAEGGVLPGSAGFSATYLSPASPLVAAPESYLLPPHAVTPLPSGTGPMAGGTTASYTHPLFQDTSATGFCAGVTVTASAGWSAVEGGLLDFGGGAFGLTLLATGDGYPYLFLNNNDYTWCSGEDAAGQAAWEPGSSHTFKGCVEPQGTAEYPSPSAYLYVDAVQVASCPVGPPSHGTAITPDLSDPSSIIVLGSNSVGAELGGGGVARVFICPTPDPATCN